MPRNVSARAQRNAAVILSADAPHAQALAINTDQLFDVVLADDSGRQAMGTVDLHNAFKK
jgi:hypothetical protein